jgi:uncharacterized membrane protein YfcA
MLIENPLNASELAFPVLECIHIIAFAISVGTIAIVDFRLLGVGMRHQKAADLNKDLWLWTLAGLVVGVFSGLLLYSSDPDMYYLNVAFLFKMACLLAAIIFHYTIHRKVVSSDAPNAYRKTVACLSLALWASVIFGGIFIGFVNAGL